MSQYLGLIWYLQNDKPYLVVLRYQSATCGSCHVKTCLWAYVDSKGPDQPAHSCPLIGAFAVCYMDTIECCHGEQKKNVQMRLCAR